MKRTTVIFGNGLGMALDPNYFQLKAALEKVWNDTDLLSTQHKALIKSVLPDTSDKAYPESEEQLDNLQVALFAAERLKEFESPEVQWLNDNSREMIAAFKRFIHQTSHYFHKSQKRLPDEFLNPLIKFIQESKSHVALLNYDNLIYDPFCNRRILSGYNLLIDGYRTEFSPAHLERYGSNRRNLGWYLNLHGSPLFVGNRKESGVRRDFLGAEDECHIVLTHVTHKPAVIQNSQILSEYWDRLEQAIDESSDVIVFGCSGEDAHLNKVIAEHASNKMVGVVEWQGSGAYEKREAFWQSAFHTAAHVEVTHMNNILDFQDWTDAALPF
jgi:hypothetical protein